MLVTMGKQKQHKNGGFRHFMVDLPRFSTGPKPHRARAAHRQGTRSTARRPREQWAQSRPECGTRRRSSSPPQWERGAGELVDTFGGNL